jgi:hypothetical protein
MLNKLQEMKGPTFIYTPLRTYFKEVFKETFICTSSKKNFLKTFLTKSQL